MNNHSKLSASKSHRWVLCPGSIKAEENFPDKQNKYSEEGTLAHEIANKILNKEDITTHNISSEMIKNIKTYTDYINNICDKNIYYPEIYIERQVSYDHIIPDGYGTADSIIINGNNLHIIDFKYGIGNKVEAYNNTQLLLYASGALNSISITTNIESIHLHIVQPRINHFDKWVISLKELSFYEGYIKAKAEEALRDNAPRIPSEKACKWCKANSSCIALYNFTSDIINMPDIDNYKMKSILDNSKMVKNFLNSVEKNVYEKLLTGEEFPGYKLVEGKNLRKIKTENLFELLGEKAYIKSTIGITALEKMVDKETLKSLVYYSKGSPLLVKKDDKRDALKRDELNFESFKE